VLTYVVASGWLLLVLWGVGPSARGPVYWAVTSFLLSQTVYVPSIAVALGRLTGSGTSCDLFMNVWGLLSAFAVLVALGMRTRRDLLAGVIVTAAATAALLALAAVERPSPVGCIATLDVPWTSAYWWLLVVVHCGSSGVASVACARVAARCRADRRLAVGMAAFAGAFAASTLFWAAMGVTLVSDVRAPALVASAVVFPITVALTVLALAVAAFDGVVVTLRARSELRELWARYADLHARHRPDQPVPRREDVVGAWWRSPTQKVHRLRIRIADAELVGGPSTASLPAEEPTSRGA
jgi:hypothetical protein